MEYPDNLSPEPIFESEPITRPLVFDPTELDITPVGLTGQLPPIITSIEEVDESEDSFMLFDVGKKPDDIRTSGEEIVSNARSLGKTALQAYAAAILELRKSGNSTTLRSELAARAALAASESSLRRLKGQSRLGVYDTDPYRDISAQQSSYSELLSKRKAQERAAKAELAGKKVRQRFNEVLQPLLDAARATPHLKEQVEAFLDGPNAPGNTYKLSVDAFGGDRNLSGVERAYLESVAPMSEINPGLAAIARITPDTASIVLDFHFARMRRESSRKLEEKGSVYAPVTIIGAGPHGIMTAGELMRVRPDLTDSALVIDANPVPGSIWAQPNGKAWEMNSASPVAAEPFVRPPRSRFVSTIRDAASMFAWYPAERGPSQYPIGREGSINTLVGYFPAPDTINPGRRYITNRDMAVMLQLQASVLIRNYMQAKAVEVRENSNPSTQGRYIISVQHQNEDGTVAMHDVYTDEIRDLSGKPEINNPLPETALLQRMRNSGDTNTLPQYCETMEFFQYFADRSKGEVMCGSEIIIRGSRNSAATIVEGLSGLFESGNLRGVRKITIVGTAEQLLDRKRYAKLEDLIQRNTDRQNVLFFANGRFDGIREASEEGVFIATDFVGAALFDDTGALCKGNHIINATGFKSNVGDKYASLCASLGASFESSLRPYRLRGNDLEVGKTIGLLSGIVLGGTAVDPALGQREKTVELPAQSREVLECVGDNVVALGFVGQSTRAAMAQSFDRARVAPPELEGAEPLRIEAGKGSVRPFTIARTEPVKLPPVDKQLAPEPELLTTLMAAAMPSHYVTVNGKPYTGTFTGSIEYPSSRKIVFKPQSAVPNMLREILAQGANQPHFRAYGQEALRRSRRRSGQLEVTLCYKDGKLDLEQTLVQAM